MARITMKLKPPKHLSAPVAAWWRQVARDYALDDHHLHLLRLAGEALDVAERARAELAEAGKLTYSDSAGNLRPHPAIAVARDARAQFARLLKQLGLDEPEPKRAPGRPPSNRVGVSHEDL